MTEIPIRKRNNEALENATKENWNGAGDGDCGIIYGEEMNKIFWNDLPIDSEIEESHRSWVNNISPWSQGSSYLQESIEPSINWIGIKSGMRGPPEPVPQSCSRAELTEYGPADFSVFVTEERKRCGDPVLNPSEMAHEYRDPGFAMYGF